jgi:hypothetical protein
MMFVVFDFENLGMHKLARCLMSAHSALSPFDVEALFVAAFFTIDAL